MRVRDAEMRLPRLWRRPRAALDSLSSALPERKLRALGADFGELWTGTRLLPSLLRFFEQRTRRRR